MITSDIIDNEVFQDLYLSTGQDPAFLSELLDTFFADAPRLMAEMRTALSSADSATFRRAAHSLKSNSANFGARRLAALAKELEEMGKACELAGAGEKLDLVEAEYGRVKTALEQLKPTEE